MGEVVSGFHINGLTIALIIAVVIGYFVFTGLGRRWRK